MNGDPDLVPMTQELPAARSGRRGRVLLWILSAVLFFAGGALAAASLLPVPAEVPAGTTVAGVPLGGMDRGQVRAELSGPVTATLARPVRLLVGADAVEVKPAEAGLVLDRTATERAVFDGAAQSPLTRFLDRRSDRRRDVAPVLAVDQEALEGAVASTLKPFTRAAKDATVTLPAPSVELTAKGDATFAPVDVTGEVVPAVTGQRVDADAAADALRAAVQAQRSEVRLTLVETEPDVTTEQAAAVDQLIGTFTTEHPCCEPRVTNIHRIAELVDGSVIAPGATFSLNAASGRRTAENGFVSAPAIVDGELVDQFGGGVSQFSTTLFNAAWFSGLPIPEHQPHSRYISRYPPGREATLDFDTIDQTIRNDTRVPVVLRTFTTGTSVTVALYGHTGDREVASTTGARVPRTGGGFSVTVQRVVRDGGSETGRDTLNWSYVGLD